ncbi:hypothetical protein SEVIR_8G245750v4 [Setaria viridis]
MYSECTAPAGKLVSLLRVCVYMHLLTVVPMARLGPYRPIRWTGRPASWIKKAGTHPFLAHKSWRRARRGIGFTMINKERPKTRHAVEGDKGRHRHTAPHAPPPLALPLPLLFPELARLGAPAAGPLRRRCGNHAAVRSPRAATRPPVVPAIHRRRCAVRGGAVPPLLRLPSACATTSAPAAPRAAAPPRRWSFLSPVSSPASRRS